VANFAQATASDTSVYATFFHAMLTNGVMLAPSQYEAMFVGLSHSDRIIDETLVAAEKAFEIVAQHRSG
jgi:glutamate-1-semialdehyde 2,1-aminomutase